MPQPRPCADEAACFTTNGQQPGRSNILDCMMIPERIRSNPSSLEPWNLNTATTRDWSSQRTTSQGSVADASSTHEEHPISRWSSSSSSSPPSSYATPTPAVGAAQPISKRHWSSAPRQRLSHRVVERRYRDNLNGQIEALRTCIPGQLSEECLAVNDVEDSPLPPKVLSKAAVLASAHTYIRELEQRQERLCSDIDELRAQVVGLQKFVRCEDCDVARYFKSLQLGASALAAKSYRQRQCLV
jgi:hypothetical protein